MRLRRLLVDRYGCFEHVDLRFADTPGAIDVVIAPNGAGKSVLRQAVHDLLFDIPLQSPMRFRFDYKGMALQAEAVASDGVPFSFGWLRDKTPKRVTDDPARFARLRAEVTPKQLEQLFALDTTRLREGGLDLAGGTTLGAALLSGTGELVSARQVQTEIRARRDAGWGPTKRTAPLNAAIKALSEARKAAAAAVQRPAQRELQEKQLADQQAEHTAAKAALRDTLGRTSQLHRIARTRPHLAALREAEAWFAAHPDAPALPPGLEERLAEARSGLATAVAALEQAAAAVGAARAQAAAIERDAAVAPHADALSRLPGMLGKAQERAEHMVLRRAERASALTQVAAALHDIGVAVPAEQAGSVVPPVATMAAARTAITAHAVLRAETEQASTRLRTATRQVAALGEELVGAAPLPDGLVPLLEEIRADRNPTQHAAEVATADRAARAAVAAALARVPGWTGGAAGLRALTLPAEAAFERLDAARAATDTAARTLAATRDRLASDQDAASVELETLRARPLPDDAAIAAARAARDRGWRLVARRAFPTEPPDAAAERAYAGDASLELAVERHIQAADALADQRIAELDRVETARRLMAEIAALDTACVAARDDAASANGLAEQAAAAWSAAVAPAGLRPDATLRDVRDVLAARRDVIDAMEAAEVADGALQAVTARHLGWGARLAAMLDTPGQGLPALLALADARVAAAAAAATALVQRDAARAAAGREHRDAADAHAAAAERVLSWEAGWTALLGRLGRPAGEAPEATEAVLDRIAALDAYHREAESLRGRIEAMTGDQAAFTAAVDALGTALGEAGTPAQALIERHQRATAHDSAWEQARLGVLECERQRVRAQDQQRAAQQALDAVVAATGAPDAVGAAFRIEAAREHTRHAGMRDAALAGLTEWGDGRSRAELQADADGMSVEAVSAELAQVNAAAAAASTRVEAAAVLLSERQAAFDAAAEATLALDTAAAHAAAAAVYGRRLEEQLVLQLAGSMLADALEAVEADAGGGGLSRISEAFGAVTDGAYGVELGGPDGTALLAVHRGYPEEKKTLHELSEGTRDQLYLALRLVALRDHAAGAPPLPFIADDILQTFDDTRAAAALRALVDLSAVVQVIVLTHHEHVATLAASLPPGAVRVQRL